jgi:hypothetical protein
MFVFDQIGATIAAFIGDGRIVARAIQTYLEVRAAIARLGTAGRAAFLVFRAALPAMSGRHIHVAILQRPANAPSFHLPATAVTIAV